MKKRIRKWIAVTMAAILGVIAVPQKAPAKEIQLKNSGNTKIMAVGSTFQIKTNMSASSLKFSSGKSSVATVSSKGLIRAKKKGKAVITIRSGKKKMKLKVTVKKPVGYTISRKAGTYTNSVTTKVKAKKGYTVYYAVSGKFKKANRIKAKSSKTFTFTETKTLKLYPVKGRKMTTAKLRKTESTSELRADYLYTVKKSSGGNNTGVTPQATATGDTIATPTPTPVNTQPAPTSSASATNTPPVASPPAGTPPVGGQPTDGPSAGTPIPPGDSQYGGDDSAAGYVEPIKAEYDDIDRNVEVPEDATEITLTKEKPEGKISADNYEISKKNKLTITAPGTYVIRTEITEEPVDGLIEVDYKKVDGAKPTEPVHIILDGVNLTSQNITEPEEDTGLITIYKSPERAVITVKDDSVNTLLDTGDTGFEVDDDGNLTDTVTYTGGIVCKKTPLTINGSGTLNICTKNGNGIKATDSLKILNTNISVGGTEKNSASGHNGITGKTELSVYQANIGVHADGDALKTTLDESDVKKDETLAVRGNMDLDGGEYKIVSDNGDAISVYRTLSLNPEKMEVTTMNLSAAAGSSCKGVKAGVTIYVSTTAGTITVDTTDTFSAQRVKADANDPYADDALHCNGSIRIDGGIIEISAGDDGIHADRGLQINGGTINIKESYEGMESADVTINDGTITIVSRDDGINAGGGNDSAGGDSFSKDEHGSQVNYQIIINGGNITINAGGDGIDSNGNIFFRGGTVTIHGPENAGNGALDYGDNNCVCEITGGTLIAAGAVGMNDAPTDGSTQPAVDVIFDTMQAAGTYVVLKNSAGEVVLTAKPEKKFQSVVMSCEALKLGESYTVSYGTDLASLTEYKEFTFTSVSVSVGSSGNVPGGGWNPGGNNPR